jgi:hypothetical protein
VTSLAREVRVLDNVASGVSATAALPGRITTCWVLSGSVDVKHQSQVILTLNSPADRLVVDGLYQGCQLEILALEDSTTFEWVG